MNIDTHKKRWPAHLAMGLMALTTGVAHADIRDQMDIQTGKAELVVPGMAPHAVAAKVKEGLSQWTIPANVNFRSLPSTIPARPDEPKAVQKYIQGAPAIEYQCQTAYAEISKRPPPIKNAFMFSAELIQACVYPFQKGVKVYLVFTSMKKTESLTSGLFNGITRAIRGADENWMTDQLQKNIADIKKEIPSLLVEKIEVPGLPPSEPDKALVAELIPAAPAAAPTPAAIETAPTSASARPGAPSSLNAKIEARKNLNAMGMVYHSQEQFFASIRRKDDVAVSLFIDAGGIDLTAKDASGKLPVEVARDIGASDIVGIITQAGLTPKAAATPVTPQVAAPTSRERQIEEIMASLSPENRAQIPALQAQIEASLDGMNVPPEKRKEEREKAMLNFLTTIKGIQSFADRIDPETGALR